MKTIYIPASRKMSRYKNVEYLYNWKLLELGEYAPEIETMSVKNIRLDAITFLRIAATELRLRFKIPIPRSWGWLMSQYYGIPGAKADMRGADVVVAHERYPKNTSLPVIWITNPTDIESKRARGMRERDIQEEIAFKQEVNRLAHVTVLLSESKKQLFDKEINPEKPTHVIPYFQPMRPISPEHFSAKWDNDQPKQLLFVGRTAIRKGLPLLLDAYQVLRKRHGDKVRLHVVSSLSDGAVTIPSLPGLAYSRRLPNERVLDLMRQAHYVVMPSEYESYGWVYIEAMAQGAIPVATESPVQRDLLDGGNAGCLVQRTADAIVTAIEPGVECRETGRALAVRALNRWKRCYAPEVVAQQFSALAHQACFGGKNEHAIPGVELQNS